MLNSETENRRTFLKQAGLAVAGGLFPSPSSSAAPLSTEKEETAASRTVLSPVSYSAVSLGPGVPESQRQRTLAVLLSISDDELLKPFRARSGKPDPGNAIGGWYDAHAYCPGHTFGQWLSAFARTCAVQQDEELQSRVRRLVAGLGSSFDDAGTFFTGDNRFPAYTLEKLNCGLIDAYSFAQDPQAADVLHRVNQLAQPHLPEKALSRAEQRKRTARDVTYTYDETYTLPENYFLAFQRTGDPYYRELALKFMHSSFLDPLANGENVLPGLHAYSHLNALNSAVQAYLVCGDKKALAAATRGFDFVQQQSYASGGWGPNEAFVTPGRGELAQSLRSTHSSFETPCGAYGHFKITRALLSITGDAKYGDSMEAVMFNTILGSLPLKPDGLSFYYSDYNLEGRKVYHATKWPCCSGTLAQASADYRINIYLQSTKGLHVNLYTPSTVRFQTRGVQVELEQSGNYPLDGDIHFRVRPARPAIFSLAFRIPAWAGGGAQVSVNGKVLPLPAALKGFVSFERQWHPNDRVTLRLPLSLRLQAIDPETPGTVALLRGPLLLYALGPAAQVSEGALLAATPDEKGQWIVKTARGDRRFTTFDRISDEDYSSYHRI